MNLEVRQEIGQVESDTQKDTFAFLGQVQKKRLLVRVLVKWIRREASVSAGSRRTVQA